MLFHYLQPSCLTFFHGTNAAPARCFWFLVTACMWRTLTYCALLKLKDNLEIVLWLDDKEILLLAHNYALWKKYVSKLPVKENLIRPRKITLWLQTPVQSLSMWKTSTLHTEFRFPNLILWTSHQSSIQLIKVAFDTLEIQL